MNKREEFFDIKKFSKFIDYAPIIFERLRILHSISNEAYLRSVGPE
jgi:hypothetical protein